MCKLPRFAHYDFPKSRVNVLQEIINHLVKGNECWNQGAYYGLNNYYSLEILALFKEKLSPEDKKKIVDFIYENNKKCPIKYSDFLAFADNFIEEDDGRLALIACVTERFKFIVTNNYRIYYIHSSVIKYVDDVSDGQRQIIFSYLLEYTKEKAQKFQKLFLDHIMTRI